MKKFSLVFFYGLHAFRKFYFYKKFQPDNSLKLKTTQDFFRNSQFLYLINLFILKEKIKKDSLPKKFRSLKRSQKSTQKKPQSRIIIQKNLTNSIEWSNNFFSFKFGTKPTEGSENLFSDQKSNAGLLKTHSDNNELKFSSKNYPCFKSLPISLETEPGTTAPPSARARSICKKKICIVQTKFPRLSHCDHHLLKLLEPFFKTNDEDDTWTSDPAYCDTSPVDARDTLLEDRDIHRKNRKLARFRSRERLCHRPYYTDYYPSDSLFPLPAYSLHSSRRETPVMTTNPKPSLPDTPSLLLTATPYATPTKTPTPTPIEIPLGNPPEDRMVTPTVTLDAIPEMQLKACPTVTFPLTLTSCHSTPLAPSKTPTPSSPITGLTEDADSSLKKLASRPIHVDRQTRGPPPTIPYDPDVIFGGDSDDDLFDYSDDEGDSRFGYDCSVPCSPRPHSQGQPTTEGLRAWQEERGLCFVQANHHLTIRPLITLLSEIEIEPSYPYFTPLNLATLGLTYTGASPSSPLNTPSLPLPLPLPLPDNDWDSGASSCESAEIEAACCSCETNSNPSVESPVILSLTHQ